MQNLIGWPVSGRRHWRYKNRAVRRVVTANTDTCQTALQIVQLIQPPISFTAIMDHPALVMAERAQPGVGRFNTGCRRLR